MVMESMMRWLLLGIISVAHALECSDFKGLWWGMMTDEMKLMLDEPTPVWMDIQAQGDQRWGQFKTLDGNHTIESMVWSAKCQQGQLQEVVIRSQNCGAPSKKVALKLPLVLSLHWENAMTDTQFKVTMQPMQLDEKKLSPKPNQKPLETCH